MFSQLFRLLPCVWDTVGETLESKERQRIRVRVPQNLLFSFVLKLQI